MPTAKVKITARVYGPRLMARTKVFPEEAHKLLDDTLQDIASVSKDLFVTNAPHQTERLRQGITAVPTRAGVAIRVSAIDPETGFNYVDVTRFGHKVRRIYPVSGRTPTGRRRFRGGYLRFVYGGVLFYRRSVRGYRPTTDWVQSPRVATGIYARQRFKVFERDLARKW